MNQVSRVMCVGCGYDLFGLDPRGLCPECGRSIQESVFRPKLWEADAAWLKQQMAGMWLLAGFYGVMALTGLVSLAFNLVLMMMGPAYAGFGGTFEFYLGMTIASMMLKVVLWIVIGWLLSRPNPMRGVPDAEAQWRKTLWRVAFLMVVVLGIAVGAQVIMLLLRFAEFRFGAELSIAAAIGLWVGVLGLYLWGLVKYGWTMWRWPELTPCGREADLFLPVLVLVVVVGAVVAGMAGMGPEYLMGLTAISVLWALADWLGDSGARKSVKDLFYVQIVMGFVPPMIYGLGFVRWMWGFGWSLGPVVYNLVLMVFIGRAVWRITAGIREGRRMSQAAQA
jgi:hypothetical protein